MSKYIDAEELLKVSFKNPIGLTAFQGIIKRQPTVDVVEVVHGKNICDSVIGHCEFKCSVCGADALSISCGSLDGGKFNYCPNCGAEMRGDTDDER